MIRISPVCPTPPFPYGHDHPWASSRLQYSNPAQRRNAALVYPSSTRYIWLVRARSLQFDTSVSGIGQSPSFAPATPTAPTSHLCLRPPDSPQQHIRLPTARRYQPHRAPRGRVGLFRRHASAPKSQPARHSRPPRQCSTTRARNASHAVPRRLRCGAGVPPGSCERATTSRE